MVLDHIGQGDDARAGVLGKEGSDPVAASAAADQAHFDVGIGLRSEDRGGFQDEDAGSCGFQETAARAFILWHEYLLLSEMVAARPPESIPLGRTRANTTASSRLNLTRSARTCARSYCACCVSQV